MGGHLVGRLAWRDRAAWFEYDQAFLSQGFEVSPFRLRLGPGVMEGPREVFDRLHGLFNDSLPDGWGRLLMDRKLHQVGVQPGRLTPLDRLAWVGTRGMGALTYVPEHPVLAADAGNDVDLDRLAGESRLVLADDPVAVLDELLRIGGSPQGARPKALVGCSPAGTRLIHGVDDLPDAYEHWIVKFRGVGDPPDVGAIEQAYTGMARQAGIAMPPTRLFPSTTGPGHFGIRRFDRVGNRRVHMHTLSGLLNIDHRLPSVGYDGLLKATRSLTRRQADVEQMFARMVFNVLAWNRDDHTKNHSFLMAADGTWSVSPAYDITFSSGPGGEHALDIAREGREPGIDHILRVAGDVGVRRDVALACVDQVKAAIDRWPQLASEAGVSATSAAEVGRRIRPFTSRI
ncbi:MAG: type II toxin-antitoxin system HipA family toxin [Azospirillaceae bacterium]|nr:type II toxin-antitoxin system HipA family toxin [Azospirillaceae bacterium]